MDCGLIDIPFKKTPFTWTNNKEGDDAILKRLDRAYCNPGWADLYPNAIVLKFPWFISDHSPICLDTNPIDRRKRRRTYKIKAWVLFFEEAMPLFKEGWHTQQSGSIMFQICRKLQLVRQKLLSWCIEWRKSHGVQWETVQDKLQQVQLEFGPGMDHIPLVPLAAKEKKMRQELLNEAQFQWIFWRQRAKSRWDQLGDAVTIFFFRSVKERKTKNRIMSLQVENDEWVMEENKITEAFVDYFADIYKCNTGRESEEAESRRTMILEEWIQHMLVLTEAQINLLSMDFTHQKIKEAVFGMAPSKAHGPDGCPPIIIQQS